MFRLELPNNTGINLILPHSIIEPIQCVGLTEKHELYYTTFSQSKFSIYKIEAMSRIMTEVYSGSKSQVITVKSWNHTPFITFDASLVEG